MADLLLALDRIANSGRLGQPVFLRCQITCPPERAVAALAKTLAAAMAVFEEVPVSLHAWGDEGAGAIQVFLSFPTGVSILAYSCPGDEAVDALLLGNHGAAYGPGAPGPLSTRDEVEKVSAAPGAHSIEALIRRSLAEGQSARWEAGENA